MAFDVYGTHGAVGWNLEQLNELRLYRATDDRGSGYTTVLRRRPLPLPRRVRARRGNAIGFEDLVVIEDYEFLRAVVEERPFAPGFDEALQWARVQAALLRSARVGPLGGRRVAAGGGRRDGRRHRRRPLRHRRHRRRPDRPHARRAARRARSRAPRSTAVYDARRRARARRRRALGVPVADGVEELLAAPDVDAVAICSPTDTHADLIVAAARGRQGDLLREAGLARPRRGRPRAGRGRGRRRAVPDRLQPPLRPRPRGGRATPSPPDASATPHLVRITSRDPAPPPLAYVAGSGGIFLDMTIHDFDMARFVTGSEVVEVFARGAVRVDPAFGEAGDVDTARVTLVHADGCLTTIDNSRQAVYGYDQRVEAFGAGGMAASENPLRAHRRSFATAAGTTGATLPYFFLERYVPSYLREWEAFVAAVRDGGPPPVGRRRRARPAGHRPGRVALAARGTAGRGRARSTRAEASGGVRIYLTGAGGFVGSNLAHVLRRARTVREVDRARPRARRPDRPRAPSAARRRHAARRGRARRDPRTTSTALRSDRRAAWAAYVERDAQRGRRRQRRRRRRSS